MRRMIAIPFALLAACRSTPSVESERVASVLAGYVLDADEHRWGDVASAFANEVTVDYSSLNGQPAETLAATALVARWRALLPGFTRTQHTLGLPHIVVEGGRATARASVVAEHFLDDARYTVGGRYEWTLAARDGAWRIERVALVNAWQTGTLDLPARAIERAAPR